MYLVTEDGLQHRMVTAFDPAERWFEEWDRDGVDLVRDPEGAPQVFRRTDQTYTVYDANDQVLFVSDPAP